MASVPWIPSILESCAQSSPGYFVTMYSISIPIARVVGHNVVDGDTSVTFDFYCVWTGQLTEYGVAPFGDVLFHLLFVSG